MHLGVVLVDTALIHNVTLLQNPRALEAEYCVNQPVKRYISLFFPSYFCRCFQTLLEGRETNHIKYLREL